MPANPSVAADQAAPVLESEGRGEKGEGRGAKAEGGSAEPLRRRDPFTQIIACLPLTEFAEQMLLASAERQRDAGLDCGPTMRLKIGANKDWYRLKHLGLFYGRAKGEAAKGEAPSFGAEHIVPAEATYQRLMDAAAMMLWQVSNAWPGRWSTECDALAAAINEIVGGPWQGLVARQLRRSERPKGEGRTAKAEGAPHAEGGRP